MPMATPNQKWSHSCHESYILAWRFTKRQGRMPDEYLLLRVSGNCCFEFKSFGVHKAPVVLETEDNLFHRQPPCADDPGGVEQHKATHQAQNQMTVVGI